MHIACVCIHSFIYAFIHPSSYTHSAPATVMMSPAPADGAPSGSRVTPLVTNSSATLCGPICSPPPSRPRVLTAMPTSTTPDTILPVARRPRYLSLINKYLGTFGGVRYQGVGKRRGDVGERRCQQNAPCVKQTPRGVAVSECEWVGDGEGSGALHPWWV